MATIPDIKINTNNDWVSVNAITSIAVGTAIKLQNKTTNDYVLNESPTKPDIEDVNGEILTAITSNEPSKFVTLGSDEIWVRAVKDDPSIITLTVQEI